MTLGQYITSVDLAVDEATDGVIHLDDLVDYADGELSLSQMYEDGVRANDATGMLLAEAGYYRL